jgi:major membrane immunogen (membrane-anchored lipoprotein)
LKSLLILAACLLALASCQNTGSTETTETTTAVDSTAIAEPAAKEPAGPQTLCYLLVANGKDSTKLNLTIATDGTVTGSYDWQPFEQHGSSGTLTGKQEGDLLKCTYDYTIEGSNQQEEVVFKRFGDQIAKGEGELVEGENGLMKIKDASKLSWMPFKKVPCE